MKFFNRLNSFVELDTKRALQKATNEFAIEANMVWLFDWFVMILNLNVKLNIN